MEMKNLIPWNRNRNMPAQSESAPILALQRNISRLFDDFFQDFDAPFLKAGLANWPSVEVSESDKEIKVVAELAGLDENDVNVTLRDGVLTLTGEKKQETNGAVYSERWHGQFTRAIEVGRDIDPDKVEARFKKGVLAVTLGKRPEAQSQVKRIAVKRD